MGKKWGQMVEEILLKKDTKMTWMPGEALLIKMWESLEKSGSGLIAPWQIKRLGRARNEVRREELLADECIRLDIEAVRSGQKGFDAINKLIDIRPLNNLLIANGSVSQVETNSASDTPINIQGLINTIQQDSIVSKLKQKLNLRKIIMFAEEEAEQVSDNQVASEQVDDDWFTNWQQRAENVSSEEMQRLWAKILSGETLKPGSYSIHTLDLLSRLSKSDAELITRLAPFSINADIIYKNDNLLSENGLIFGDILRLEELGILHGTQALGLQQTLNSEKLEKCTVTLCVHEKVIIIEVDNFKQPQISCYRITRVGNEILSLGKFKANHEYVRTIGEHFKNQQYKVQIADYNYLPDGKIRVINSKNL